MTSFQDQVVCITGAGRGIGRSLALAFSREGASLVLGSRTVPQLEALAAELGDRAVAVPTDVRSKLDVERLVATANAEFGRLDIMINNAGVAIYGPFEGVSEDDLDEMLQTNVKGAFFGSQAAYKIMKKQRSGLILNVSSIAGKLHLPNEAAYNASKWALNGFTGTLSLEARHYNVRVTSVCPGGVNTPFWKEQEFLPFPSSMDPERDFLDPDHVAQSILDIARLPASCVVPEMVLLPMIAPPTDFS